MANTSGGYDLAGKIYRDGQLAKAKADERAQRREQLLDRFVDRQEDLNWLLDNLDVVRWIASERERIEVSAV